MNIPFSVLDRQYMKYQTEYETKALEILRSGWYIMGKELQTFEKEFADYIQSKNCIGVDNGLNALVIALRALEIGTGDEVIVPANTYIATIMAITMNNATPVLVEPDHFYNIDPEKIEESITDKTRAILTVHLYGQAAQMNKITALCKKYNLKLIEDCAQSHAAKFESKFTGTFGHCGCFSFYPGKNLGCFGDGGAIITDDDNLAQKIKTLRNYGSEEKYYNKVVGYNSRLDELQAGLLRIKLLHLNDLTDERIKIANNYLNNIKNPLIILPELTPGSTNVWHLFVIRTEKRRELQEFLRLKGIQSLIHYPVPPHLSEAYSYLHHKKGDFPITENYADTVLSLPLFNGMKEEEQEFVINSVNNFS